MGDAADVVNAAALLVQKLEQALAATKKVRDAGLLNNEKGMDLLSKTISKYTGYKQKWEKFATQVPGLKPHIAAAAQHLVCLEQLKAAPAKQVHPACWLVLAHK